MTVSVRPRAVALLLLLAATGCAGTQPQPPAPRTTAGPAASAEARNLILPFDSYAQSDADLLTISSAEDVLMGPCMRAQGLAWKTLPRVSGENADPPNRRRYGVIEPEVARRYGYHPPSDPPALAQRQADEKARDAALGPRERRAAYGTDGVGGCWKKAHARLQQPIPESAESLFNDLNLRLFDKSQRDAGVVRAIRAWSACMGRAGWHYASPAQASDAPGWNKSPRVTAREIEVAEADVRCKQENHLVSTWAAAETRMQRAALVRHAAALEALKTGFTRWLVNARAVLNTT
ncbi:hypothetical protein [Streptomyces sp. NPDC017529]|uniref:hypothetical protein n=1 Tax=Streptomyces sp. NPDC017529 TaxID=3365000 RepID=UPI0037A5283B